MKLIAKIILPCLFGTFVSCQGIVTDEMGFTNSQKSEYRQNFNGAVIAYLQVSQNN